MALYFIKRLFIFASIATLYVGHSLAETIENLTIAFNEKPPFFYFDGDQPKGLVVDRVSTALRLAGYRYHFEQMPFQRMLYYLKKDRRGFAVIGLSKNDEREKYAIFSLPVFKDRTPVVLIRREDKHRFLSYKSLEEVILSGLFYGRKAGTVQTADELLKMLGRRELLFDNDVKSFPNLLSRKRFDFTILYPEEVEFALKMSGVNSEQFDIVTFPDMPPGNFRYILFSKGTDPKLIDKINSAIELLPTQH